MLKRGHAGVYRKMSKKHLQRYIDEYAGRHNIRPLATIEQTDTVIKAMNGKRLRYKELIQEESAWWNIFSRDLRKTGTDPLITTGGEQKGPGDNAKPFTQRERGGPSPKESGNSPDPQC